MKLRLDPAFKLSHRLSGRVKIERWEHPDGRWFEANGAAIGMFEFGVWLSSRFSGRFNRHFGEFEFTSRDPHKQKQDIHNAFLNEGLVSPYNQV